MRIPASTPSEVIYSTSKGKIKDGYILVYHSNHPRQFINGVFNKNRKYRPLHITILEVKLGRFLTADEVTHHIDGNKLNNHPDNLEVHTNLSHSMLHHPVEISLCGCGNSKSKEAIRCKDCVTRNAVRCSVCKKSISRSKSGKCRLCLLATMERKPKTKQNFMTATCACGNKMHKKATQCRQCHCKNKFSVAGKLANTGKPHSEEHKQKLKEAWILRRSK